MILAESAEAIARQLFSLSGPCEILPGDRDLNFKLSTESGSTYILKIANGSVDESRLRFENHLLHVAAEALDPVAVSVPIKSVDGDEIAVAESGGSRFLVRLLTWIDGMPLARFRPHTSSLFFQIGSALGRLSNALREVDAGSNVEPPSPVWLLDNAESVIRQRLEYVESEDRLSMIKQFLEHAAPRVAASSVALPRQIVHHDPNDYNLLVGCDRSARPRLCGLIDFGDAARGYRIADLAIACAYGMLDKPDPLEAACAMARGFHRACPVKEAEADILIDLIILRLCASVAVSSERAVSEPDNEYAAISSRPAWDLLARMRHESIDLARFRLRDACGFEPNPASHGVREWLSAHRTELHPVCEVDPRRDRLTILDLSVGSRDPVLLQDEPEATALILDRIARERAAAAIGRYDEARLAYTDDRFRVATWTGWQNRTIHLGIDIFLPSGSPVFAPLSGRIRAATHEPGAQGFGTVVILEHEPPDGPRFFTLYGHLSAADAERFETGELVAAGGRIGSLGRPDENGGWTPHLHFQILTHQLDLGDGFPGVALERQRRLWCSVCPDPNLILQIPEDLLESPHMACGDVSAARNASVAKSLSLSYEKPLHIVRGSGTRLFDSTGRSFLDCVNNVCHVGHGHPEVVRAVADQMRVLNTNTRYLHENIVRYARRLSSLLPDQLDTCIFVNSGSEANDLAIRMARAFTGRRSVVVIDGAYHGHLSSLIPLSPYKFDGPGGTGREDGVHVAAMPDTYRGLHRGSDAGHRYAADVERCLNDAEAGGGAAAFLFEPMLSCGGQIDPPPGYLTEACAHAARHGSVAIADEVQVGFGRVGETFWAFERHDVVPDIVTLGKPIGNGFPLGAVVTTKRIAEAFDNGMEYFNTFGGNPVACAAGMAVLDVIENEGLSKNALDVGSRLKARLVDLAGRNPAIGDVRGAGLFLGFELVRDPTTREPASEEARYLVNRARELGVLLSTDGPDRNVVKIKPPIVFSDRDADDLVSVVQNVLADSLFQGQGFMP